MRTGAEVAVFVTRREGREVLLVHRAPSLGGYWHVVAGGVEAGETAPDAARRELREETALDAPWLEAAATVVEYAYPLSEEPVGRRAGYPAGLLEVRVDCFLVEAAADWEPRLNWEHDGHRWCSPREAGATLRWPSTAAALRRALRLE